MQIAAFAILGLVLIIVGFILQFILPEIKLVGWSIMGLGIILLAGSFIIEFRRVRTAVASRRGKFRASTTIMVSVFIGIILLVNAISANFHTIGDLSGLSQFTLTPQTKDVLTKLKTPIDVLCFFVPSVNNIDSNVIDPNVYVQARQYAPALLYEYQTYTDKLNISVVDPDQHPEIARKYNISTEYLYQSVVFQTPEGYRLVPAWEIFASAENSFTSAILEVSGTKQKKIYFLTGHGEVNPTDTTSIGYSNASKELLNNLFLVDTLDLLSTPSIPDDCAVLVVAGPQKAMSASERQIIANYLKSNRSAVFFTNPDSPDDIAQLLTPWGVDVKNGIIVDPTSYAVPNKDSPQVDRSHNAYGLTTLYFPGATAIIAQATPPTGMDVQPLLQTSADAFMTDSYNPATNQKFDASKDLKGPLFMGYLIEPSQATTQNGAPAQGPVIAVVGDSDFATNNNFYNGDNGNLFLNIVNGFARSTQLISVDSKILQTHKLVLTPEKLKFLTISSIGLLPALVLVVGVIVWWRRR